MKRYPLHGARLWRRRTPNEIATILQEQRRSGLSLLALHPESNLLSCRPPKDTIAEAESLASCGCLFKAAAVPGLPRRILRASRIASEPTSWAAVEGGSTSIWSYCMN
jgi:hypothetical protein